MKKITKKTIIFIILFSAAGIFGVAAEAKKDSQGVAQEKHKGYTIIESMTAENTPVQHKPIERTSALDFTAGEVIYAGGKGTGDPGRNDIVDSIEGWKWYRYGDAGKGYSEKTLILEGINLSADADKVLVVPDGTTIILKGINTIASRYSGKLSCYCLYACGSLTITGDDGDILAIMGGNPNSPYTVTSMGLYAQNLMMEGGRVTAVGGEAKFSRGISLQTELNINGGSLYGLGGAASDGTVGVWMGGKNSTVTLSKGTLSAIGGTASIGSSYGLYGSSCNISVTGGELTASGTVGGRGSFGVHILRNSVFTCEAGSMTLRGDDMATNHIPTIEGDYEYKIKKEAAAEPESELQKGRIGDFFSCKYITVHINVKDNADGDAELG